VVSVVEAVQDGPVDPSIGLLQQTFAFRAGQEGVDERLAHHGVLIPETETIRHPGGGHAKVSGETHQGIVAVITPDIRR
jgi:hypothetical protein